ncbi:hypothetical protein [Sulfurospirillum barnesii]|uniref:Uncharacterized protein n=1 Tax=Sulfurospirillum barnesii (strain ATCC 700032 / DSM 10660 / SES-3) TaxID=760154 RepID=I3XWF9_SULBS|nr:hypothetical protein [Sulfurospirillum barnesii]AFL68283.1 hypothetical protein Sulba_0984 [Sulfurospirillum barnesii SES-3]
MFSKFINLFKVKEDETLHYMNPEKLSRFHKNYEDDPLSEEDEDAFFRQLEEEKYASIAEVEHEKKQAEANPNRASVLEKMRACMHQREWTAQRKAKLLVTLFIFVAGSLLLFILMYEPHNPLIGKWQPQKKSNIFIPTGDIEFRKEAILANGVSTPIEYIIESQYVEVIDSQTKTRIRFERKDERTIELNLLGVKTTYKKIP